jgi:hypothetical protein
MIIFLTCLLMLTIVSTAAAAVASPTPTPSPSPTPAAAPPPLQLELTEIMACPETGQLEWIELHNIDSQTAILTNWKVRDEADNAKTVSLEIPAGQYLIADWTGSLLNNTGDELHLETDEGETLLSVELPACTKGSSFILVDDEWLETTTPTPGQMNPDYQNQDPAAATDSSSVSLTAGATTANSADTTPPTALAGTSATSSASPPATTTIVATKSSPPPDIPYQFPHIPIQELETANPFRGGHVQFQTFEPNRTGFISNIIGGLLLCLIGLGGLLRLAYRLDMLQLSSE